MFSWQHELKWSVYQAWLWQRWLYLINVFRRVTCYFMILLWPNCKIGTLMMNWFELCGGVFIHFSSVWQEIKPSNISNMHVTNMRFKMLDLTMLNIVKKGKALCLEIRFTKTFLNKQVRESEAHCRTDKMQFPRGLWRKHSC